MTHDELVEKVARAIMHEKQTNRSAFPDNRDLAKAAIDTIREALQEPTEGMWEAFFVAKDETFPNQMKKAHKEGRGWKGMPAVVWQAMLNASPLEEQSE